MSNLVHENIIKYERAFQLPDGKICIVMELAVNDLLTHKKARASLKRRTYLSLQCIRSIGHQALLALHYLHSRGVTHRDLKPTNILVTNWDIETDIPTIKLADFGLAAVSSTHTTFCGTEGYVAPEIQERQRRIEEFRNRKGWDIEAVPPPRLVAYNHSVDIWSLGKVLLEFVTEVPDRLPVLRGKSVPLNKQPALRLIDRMMQEDPSRRPSAAECLRDPWMSLESGSRTSLCQKREMSPTSSNPAHGAPFKKLARGSSINHANERQSSMFQIAKMISPDGLSQNSDFHIEHHSLYGQDKVVLHDHQSTQQGPNVDDWVQGSFNDQGHNYRLTFGSLDAIEENITPALMACSTTYQKESSSLQGEARRLLAPFGWESIGNGLEVDGNCTSAGVVLDGRSRMNISKTRVYEGRDETSAVTRSSFGSVGSDINWASSNSKGVTYSSLLDDPMAGVSY